MQTLHFVFVLKLQTDVAAHLRF